MVAKAAFAAAAAFSATIFSAAALAAIFAASTFFVNADTVGLTIAYNCVICTDIHHSQP
ncbi:hypothetical protein HCB90_04395 [Streptococcus suis]|nr:hypothetical protein [Streptococcus suis]